MKIVRHILVWVLWLLSMVAGAVLLLWSESVKIWFSVAGEEAVIHAGSSGDGMESLLRQVEQTSSMSLASAVIGVTLLSCGIVYVWACLRSLGQGATPHSLEFKDAQGGIRISIKALQESLARSIKELPEVHEDMRVSIHATSPDGAGSPVHVVASGSAYSGSDLNLVGEKIRIKLRDHFQGMLRLEDNVRFDVNLQRIIPREAQESKNEEDTGRAPNTATGQAIDFPISGPVYPVDDDVKPEGEWDEDETVDKA
ncbi:MAG: hypothetical protein O3B01_06440 [Planctomycetota bacterium]|nr:hypothetical protein [Planctomycetota bacterium]MDA1138203.1 hypothetical protein [Planctomycetota bacterium]